MRLVSWLSLMAMGCGGPPVEDGKPLPIDVDGDGVFAADDCNDSNAAVKPGAPELCDGLDNNCDGNVDGSDATDLRTWYADADGDYYGVDTGAVQSCVAPSGYVAVGGDCNDDSPRYRPGAPEADCTDPNDYNCDGSVAYADADGDGFPACEDCNDASAAIHDGAAERCDGIDQDCDGAVDDDAVDAATWYLDADGDSHGLATVAV
ncbi:MAG TPA: putative metal-binding motif-containing protein, partial [Myxococcota bacterium]|nr:putative metal-binding motif-containing protein [Myxococcota bacterium]